MDELGSGQEWRACPARELRVEVAVDERNLGGIQHRRHLRYSTGQGFQPHDPDAVGRDAHDVGLPHHTQPAMHVAPVPGLQQCGHGRALLLNTHHLPVTKVAVLAEDSIAEPNVAAPVLGVHHEYPAGSHKDVVEVGFRPAWPMDVVKGQPTADFETGHRLRDEGLTRCPNRPRMRAPLSLLQLPAQTFHSFRGQP